MPSATTFTSSSSNASVFFFLRPHLLRPPTFSPFTTSFDFLVQPFSVPAPTPPLPRVTLHYYIQPSFPYFSSFLISGCIFFVFFISAWLRVVTYSFRLFPAFGNSILYLFFFSCSSAALRLLLFFFHCAFVLFFFFTSCFVLLTFFFLLVGEYLIFFHLAASYQFHILVLFVLFLVFSLIAGLFFIYILSPCFSRPSPLFPFFI